jgi:anti-anti-sigma factor
MDAATPVFLRIERTDYAHESGEVVVLALAGELCFDTAHRLARALPGPPTRPQGVVLHLSGVTLLDSTGLSALMQARKQTQAQNARFCLAHLSPVCRRQLRRTCLLNLFVIYETLEEAVRESD